MNILHDYILIKVEKEQEKTKSGIMLQTSTVKLPNTGTIVAVGPEVKTVMPGQRVEFLRYAAIDGTDEDTRFCKEKHIIAIH